VESTEPLEDPPGLDIALKALKASPQEQMALTFHKASDPEKRCPMSLNAAKRVFASFPEGVVELDLQSCGMHPKYMEALAPSLAAYPRLQILDIRGNDCGKSGIAALAEFLKTNPPLSKLACAFICGSASDDPKTSHEMETMKRNPQSFQDTYFLRAIKTARHVTPLAEALTTNTNMKMLKVELRGTDKLSGESWKKLCKGLPALPTVHKPGPDDHALHDLVERNVIKFRFGGDDSESDATRMVICQA